MSKSLLYNMYNRMRVVTESLRMQRELFSKAVPEVFKIIDSFSYENNDYVNVDGQVDLNSFATAIKSFPDYEWFKGVVTNKREIGLKDNQLHDGNHSDNVAVFAYYIAHNEGLSADEIKMIVEASLYHDVGRIDDRSDEIHGFYSARMYLGPSFSIESNDEEKFKVAFIIQAHSLRKLDDVVSLATLGFDESEDIKKLIRMALIVRDADALDRTRFLTNNFNPDFLNSKFSKSIILAAGQLNNCEQNLKALSIDNVKTIG